MRRFALPGCQTIGAFHMSNVMLVGTPALPAGPTGILWGVRLWRPDAGIPPFMRWRSAVPCSQAGIAASASLSSFSAGRRSGRGFAVPSM